MLPFLSVFSLLLTGALAADPSSKVALTPELSRWKSDIESAGKTTVVLARVFTDSTRNELLLPEDAEFRPFLRTLLISESFVGQFVQTHAINVSSNTGVRPISVVFLNMARSADWEGHEEAVIAHEFGHLWLQARGYQAPKVVGGLSCEAVHAGDIVQHVLIRGQMQTRHIDFQPFWIRTLETALEQMNRQPGDANLAPGDRCQRISRLALWVDVELGLSDEEWQKRQTFLTALRAHFPELNGQAAGIAAMLRGQNLQDRQTYLRTLRSVLLAIHHFER